MADITISDLELAPALADDMVLVVENITDTYAATLAMLRRLINKTFVEVGNADFNALTDDGFYQCTGTPTNSPVAGAINWTLQVSAENGVVVQRAFSLDDNFANIYIRRFNGVTWTAWLDVGAGALANKANISLSNIDVTGQAILNGKAKTDASNFTAEGKETIYVFSVPDYARAYGLVKANGIAPNNGFLWCKNADNASSNITINGYYWYLDGSYGNEETALIPVKKGDSYSSTAWGTMTHFNFIPHR